MRPKKNLELHSTHAFLKRVLRNLAIGLAIIGFSLFLGMYGYHSCEQMNWTDAYLNASMILSGMGPVTELHTNTGKIFAGSYALFSGIVFLIIMALILAPIFHRILHKLLIKDS